MRLALEEFRQRMLEEVECLARALEADGPRLRIEDSLAGLPESSALQLDQADLNDEPSVRAQKEPGVRRAMSCETGAQIPYVASRTFSRALSAFSPHAQQTDRRRSARRTSFASDAEIERAVTMRSVATYFSLVESLSPQEDAKQPAGTRAAGSGCQDALHHLQGEAGNRSSRKSSIMQSEPMSMEVSSQKGNQDKVADAQVEWLPRSMSVFDLRSHYKHQQRAKWSFDVDGVLEEFSLAENLRIEDAFWRGEERVRIRSGSPGEAPLEIWFKDMIQLDPATKQKIGIARKPPAPIWLHLHRRVLAMARGHQHTSAQFEKANTERITRLQMARSAGHSLYSSSGCFAFAARSVFMSSLFSIMVFLNAIWLGVESEVNREPLITQAHPAVQAIEFFFLVFFAAEIVARFAALKRKCSCFRSPAFLLDLVLVMIHICQVVVLPLVVLAFSVSEESFTEFESLILLRLARLLRTARLGRVVQVLRNVPEAMVLLQGIRKAFRSLAVTLLLELLLVYSFGLLFRTYTAGSTEFAQVFFPDILSSMHTLIIRGLFLDGASKLLLHDQITPEVGAFFILFVFLGCFLLLNVLVGLICEIITGVSNEQREEADVDFLVQFVLDLVECYADWNNKLHRDDLELVLSNPEMRAAMNRFGVDVRVLSMSMRSHLAKETSDGDDCTVEEFLNLILCCRKSNTASVADIMQLQAFMESKLK